METVHATQPIQKLKLSSSTLLPPLKSLSLSTQAVFHMLFGKCRGIRHTSGKPFCRDNSNRSQCASAEERLPTHVAKINTTFEQQFDDFIICQITFKPNFASIDIKMLPTELMCSIDSPVAILSSWPAFQ